MTLTREEILAMEPGEELDALIGKEILGIVPAVQWWAMDGEEEGIFITFHYESEANEWMVDQERRFPGWNEKNGTHIVRKEIFRNYSGSISAAYEVLANEKSHQLTFSEAGFSHSDLKYRAIVGRNQDVAYAKTAPEAICKARLLAVLNL
jgi:hypothetical protein